VVAVSLFNSIYHMYNWDEVQENESKKRKVPVDLSTLR
jgi:hypothetical protein